MIWNAGLLGVACGAVTMALMEKGLCKILLSGCRLSFHTAQRVQVSLCYIHSPQSRNTGALFRPKYQSILHGPFGQGVLAMAHITQPQGVDVGGSAG